MSIASKNTDRASFAVSIVLYRTNPRLLERTLTSLAVTVSQSIEQGLLGDSCRLFLIDHSPSPVTFEQQECWREMVSPMLLEYHFAGRNPGYGAGHNLAFCHAGVVDYFLVANPDLEFAPRSLVNGLGFLGEHPEIGLLGPALIEPDGNLRPACFRSPDLLTLFSRLCGGTWARRRSYNYECRDWDPASPVFSPPHVSGCCMLFRGSAYKMLGGFDPGFFLYFEDFDLSGRAQQHGLSAYCPAMKIIHHGGGASRKNLRHHFLFIKSAARFFWLRRGSR